MSATPPAEPFPCEWSVAVRYSRPADPHHAMPWLSPASEGVCVARHVGDNLARTIAFYGAPPFVVLSLEWCAVCLTCRGRGILPAAAKGRTKRCGACDGRGCADAGKVTP